MDGCRTWRVNSRPDVFFVSLSVSSCLALTIKRWPSVCTLISSATYSLRSNDACVQYNTNKMCTESQQHGRRALSLVNTDFQHYINNIIGCRVPHKHKDRTISYAHIKILFIQLHKNRNTYTTLNIFSFIFSYFHTVTNLF